MKVKFAATCIVLQLATIIITAELKTITTTQSPSTTEPEIDKKTTDAHKSHTLNFTIKSIRNNKVSSTNYNLAANLSSEDLKAREDWGGNCTDQHWKKCASVQYFYDKDDDGTTQDDSTGKINIKCKFLYWCHNNGWTINQCHIMCMAKCSRELLIKMDRFIKHEGECSYQ